MLLAGDFIPKRLPVKLPKEFTRQLVLANLEGPICADGLPLSDKVGVCLHTTASEALEKSIGRFAFSLANNHMMDFREEGLNQTKRILAEYNIPFAGAGENEAEARKPMILEEDGVRIAVFSCCERQFGIATETIAGCAAMGVWLYRAIREAKVTGMADRVIVSCHAASEFSPWVSPELHDFYHSLIDAGADCIHGHHAHVPQGYEEYNGRPIFYGLGNFVIKADDWGTFPHYHWSLVGDVRFRSDKVEWNVCPYVVSRTENTIEVSKANEHCAIDCHGYIKNVNDQFSSRDNLNACWQEVACRLYYRLHVRNLRPPPVVKVKLPMRDRFRLAYFALWELWRALIGRERPTTKSIFYGKVFYNAFNCQSHRDMVKTAMGVHTGVLPDLRNELTAEMAERLGV